MDVAKSSRRSAPGLDAWTHGEAAPLPPAAWAHFLRVLEEKTLFPVLLTLSLSFSFFSSLSIYIQTVPLAKTESAVCLPAALRPIDGFSLLFRIHSTTMTREVTLLEACLSSCMVL